MRDEQSLFLEKRVTTIGVNAASVAAHEKYTAKFGFNFPLASDPDRRVAAMYNATRPKIPMLTAIGESIKPGAISIVRTVYLVGQDGTVLFGQRGSPATAAILAPLD